MSKVSATITVLNDRFNALGAHVTSAKGLIRFPDSGTPLEDIIEGLTENGADCRIYLSSVSRAVARADLFGSSGAAIITGQMVIKLARTGLVDLSTYDDLVDEILASSMLEIDNGEALRASADALPIETMDGYLWTVFEFDYKFPPCTEEV